MSRCFPFPPPGYEPCSLPLFDSGAIEKERKRAEKERKSEKSRNKKEKKHKSSEERGRTKGKKHDRKRKNDEGRQGDQNVASKPSKRNHEPEQLEKSGLTEEHYKAAGLHQCYASDSSQDSKKRKKDNLLDGSHGGTDPIRLSSPSFSEPRPASIELPCFSGRAEPISSLGCFSEPISSPSFSEPRPASIELPCFSASIEAEASPLDLGLFKGYNGTTRSRRKGEKFKDLIVNWNPPALSMEILEDIHQEWLSCKNTRYSSQDVCLDQVNDLCSWPPRACHLPDGKICVLPYVVPF